MTKLIYEDRSAWIRLETNPDAEADAAGTAAGDEIPALSSGTIAGLLKGVKAEKDYDEGVVSFMVGKTYYTDAFVGAELMVLTPQLAAGLRTASPRERVAYCLTTDWSATERFVTTGWAYIKKPYLYFKLVEWRTPIRVKSPAVPTSEACSTKPAPGYKSSDRFFQLNYVPKAIIVTHGPLGRSILNGRGEIVFKLAELNSLLPGERQPRAGQGSGETQAAPPPALVPRVSPITAPGGALANGKQVQQPGTRTQQPDSSKEALSKPLTRAKPLGNAMPAAQ